MAHATPFCRFLFSQELSQSQPTRTFPLQVDVECPAGHSLPGLLERDITLTARAQDYPSSSPISTRPPLSANISLLPFLVLIFNNNFKHFAFFHQFFTAQFTPYKCCKCHSPKVFLFLFYMPFQYLDCVAMLVYLNGFLPLFC